MNDHPRYALGRRPPKRAPALKLTSFFDATKVPKHDPTDDNLGDRPFGLYENDRYGDCGPTSVANNVIQVTGGEVVPSQDDVFDLYRRSGNPGFDPVTGMDDNGVIMQTMLEHLLEGGIGGRRPVAFAKVDETTDRDFLEAAINTFDGVLFGVDLEVAQQQQTDENPPVWDYQRSGEWGGHAILAGAFDTQASIDVISWALRVKTTEAFREHQLDEAWIVVWPEHLNRPGVDRAALAEAFRELTGRDLPIPSPEPTPPAPDPSPPRKPGTVFQVGPFTDRQVHHLAYRARRGGFNTIEAYVTYQIKHVL